MTSAQPSRDRFDALLAAYGDGRAITDDYAKKAQLRGWETFRHLPAGTGKEKILDVGSMFGMYAPAYIELWNYGEAHLIGTETTEGGIMRRPSRDPNGKTYEFPATTCNIELERWPYPDNMFDTVVCTEVIEHMLFDPVFMMNELCRVLKPGGHALLTTPNVCSDTILVFLVNNMQPGYLRQYFSDALKTGKRTVGTIANLGHFHEYTAPEFSAVARATGFEVLHLGGFSPYPQGFTSFRFELLKIFTRVLFPNSKRIREDYLLMLARKTSYTPLEKMDEHQRYPAPLFRPLSA